MTSCLVDEIAKIIEPQAFIDWQSRVEFSLLKGDHLREAVAYADWISGLEPLRSKAKEIIDIIGLRAEREMVFDQSCPEIHLSFGG
jgi:hypothetical protein